MTARLYDRASGKVVEVDDADITRLVGSGSHAFEANIDIPVVSPEGQLGSLSSNEAEMAFKQGYRWTTPADTKAYEERRNEEILQQRFGQDQLINAGTAGVLRGYTAGLTDIVAPVYAEAVYGEGKGEQVRQALGEVKTRNPIVSTIGEIGGAVAGVPGALAAKAASTVLKAAPVATTLAGRLASNVASEAAQGATYGLGDGISEAALGDPNEIAQNLASSVEMGALFGGAFGGAFGVAKEVAPSAKALISRTAQGVEDAFQLATRKTTGKALDVALSTAQNEELRKVVGELVDDPEFRRVMFDGGIPAVKKLYKDVTAGEKLLSKESGSLSADLNKHMATAPKAIRAEIDAALPQANGNLNKAMEDVSHQIDGSQITLNAALKESREPSTYFSSVYDDTMELVKRLERTGDSKARTVAKTLESNLNAEMSSRGVNNRDLMGALTAGEEHIITSDLRRQVQEALGGKTAPKVQDLLSKYDENLTYLLHGNEAFGVAQQKLDNLSGAYGTLRSFLTGATKSASTADLKQTVINRILTDPRKAETYDLLLANISEMVPEMHAFRLAGKDAVARTRALEGISAKIGALGDRRLGKGLSLEEYGDLVSSLKPDKNIIDKASRLKEVNEALSQALDTNPLTRYMAIQKALGNPIDDAAKNLLKYGSQFQAVEKHFAHEYGRSTAERLIAIVAKRGVRSLAGATIGGYLGDSTGAVLGGAAAGFASPYHVLKNLTRLERVSSASFKRTSKALQGAVDALTGEKAAKFAAAVSGTKSQATLSDRRESFKERSAYLKELQDPAHLVAEIENRMGDLKYTPQIGAAMGAQFTQTAHFLESKLPRDPLAGRTLNPFKSPWQPSDFELSKFERYVNAAENPTATLEALAKGDASPEAIETLKTLYPKIYERLQQRVMDAIMDPATSLTYKQRLHIGTLFEMPTDATTSPQFIATMQSQYEEQPGRPESSPSPQGKTLNINIHPEATATETTRISNS